MKPTLNVRNECDSIGLARRAFPKTSFNYQATSLADIDGTCARSCRPSFRAISRDYFANEAAQHFAHEAVLFSIMMMAAALPLLNAATAVLKLISS
jgi:hypothetical protein